MTAYRRDLSPLARAAGGILGRGGRGDRLGDSAGTGCSTTAGRRFTAGSPAARLNTCWNALDRHVAAGNGERVALIYDSPVTDTIASFTYRELRDRVARLAGVLTGLGVEKGDRVLIYMPMVPEAAIAMLACARHRRDPFGGVRRLRRARAGDPHRRRQAAVDPHRLVRRRGQPGRPLQAAARRGDRRGAREAASLRRAAAADVPGRADPPAATTIGTSSKPPRTTGRLRAGAGDRPALHPLHLGHDRHPQGRGARQWRPCGRARTGRCATSTGCSPTRCSGPPPMSAGWSGIRTSSTRR